MQNDLNKKIGKAAGWSSVTEIAAKLVSPIVNMVLARLLAPEEFGVVATITMVISFAELFIDAGFQKYIIQHEYKDEDELNRSSNVAFWTNLGVSVLICMVIFFLRHSIAELVGSPGLGNSISVASIIMLIGSFSSIQMARFKRLLDFRTLFFVRMGGALVPLVITVPLAFALRNYWALLIGNICCQLFTAVLLTVKSSWRPSFSYSFRLLREMLSFSIWTLLESVSIWLTTYVDVFIVGRLLSEHYLGLYKTSMTTVNSYMALITSAITPVIFSALSRYQNDDRRFSDTYYKFQRLAAVFVIPMGVGIYLFRDLVTGILLGAEWMEISDFVGLWGLTGALTVVFSHFASEVYRSKGNPKVSLVIQLIHIAFIVPTILLSLRAGGFEALYTSRALVRLQLILSAMVTMQVLYKFRIRDMIKNVAPMIVCSVIMGVVGAVGDMLCGGNVLCRFLVIALCVVVYFAALLLLFPKECRQITGAESLSELRKKAAGKIAGVLRK